VIILRPEDPPYLVGRLPRDRKLPILVSSVEVHLSYQTYRHIIERRDNERPEHIALVLARLDVVIGNPTHAGCLTGEDDKVDLFSWASGDFAGVLVAVKCLAGETWISTAFPVGRKTLRKHLNTGRLCAVEYEQVDALDP
jgi:hypothetical protein